MKWMRSVWRWGSLGLSVAALGGLAFAGKQWAEQHALEAVLGQGAHSDALSIHWRQSAGCAENVRIPLDQAASSQASSRLTARRVWFSYDFASLLRKRVILPRLVIDEAHIVASSPPTEVLPPSQPGNTAAATSRAWIDNIHNQTAAISQEKFASGTQVAIDTAMLSEQWQAKFVDVHHRAQRILSEAKDIHQELSAMDNPLRQEAKVIASRERLERLKGELATLRNTLLKTDKTLREQQSRIREALLTEKRALEETGSAFDAPPANELAETALGQWLAVCLKEPTQYSVLLSELICSPYREPAHPRGLNIRHTDTLTAEFAVGAAKIAGDISLVGPGAPQGPPAPFTASGTFQVLPYTSVVRSRTSRESARWQMAVGSAMHCISLEGTARNARAGMTAIELECSAQGQLEAACQVTRDDISGTGQVRLREWLVGPAHAATITRMLSDDPVVQELLDAALVDLKNAPDKVEFQFARDAGAMRVTLADDDTRWLAEQLARGAAAYVSKRYAAAAQTLETYIVAELDAMNRAVAISYNEESQHLHQLMQEIKVLQADVMNNLAQRAGAEFARKSAGDTIR